MAVLTARENYPDRFHPGHSPFVRFVLALAVGIGIGIAVVPDRALWAIVGAALLVVLVALISIRCTTRLRQHRYYSLLGFFVLMAWGLVGCLLTWQTHPRIDRSHFSRTASTALVGVIADEPVVRGNHVRFPLAVKRVYGSGGLEAAGGRMMLTVHVGDSSSPIRSFNYGDELLVPAGYQPVPPPYNPGELDYRAFLAGRDIWHQDYLNPEEVRRLAEKKGNPMIRHALALRQRMVAKFSTYIPDRDAYSVASALILGYRAEMSDSLVGAFSSTGTIHVLSVSGMHVVIVFWLLANLLWWMDRGKKLRIAKFLLLLVAVWGYALLTGFSPPVLRASIMVSFVMAATIFGQQNRIYNSIAASAFFLLLYQPKFLVDIGFQLSYLAVLGIVFLHPIIRGIFGVRNRLLRPVTDYVGVSIGAQAGAGPLAAYYFHQFPLYFLPANLFIVLPASGIMYMGFLLLLLPSGRLAAWVGTALEKLILFTNAILGYIEQLPMASIRGIWMSWWESLLVYGLITAVVMAVGARSKRWVYGVFGCAILLLCGSLSDVLRGNTDGEVILFNTRRHLAIGLLSSDGVWLYTDFPTIDDRTIGYSVLPALESRVPREKIRLVTHGSTYHHPLVHAEGGLLQFGYTRLLIYDGTHTYAYDGRFPVDLVVLRNNPSGPLTELLGGIECKQLILDGSNFDSNIARWRAEARLAGIPVYVLKNNFAYVWPSEPPAP